MSIKWKYFIVLLAFSLAPFLAGMLVLRDATEDMVSAASAKVEGNLTAIVSEELLRSALASAQAVRDQSAALEMALQAVALETQRLLAEPAPSESARVYYSWDYADNGTAPLDLQADDQYRRPREGGGYDPVPVSFGYPVFLLAPDVDLTSSYVQGDIQRLARLTPLFRKVFERIRPFADRLHVTLYTGVTVIYPGQSGYPKRQDARKTAWYGKSLGAKPEPDWANTEPMVSTSTGKILFSLTMPLLDAKGRPAGVAAIDAPVTMFLQENRLSLQWSDAMHSFLVRPDSHNGAMGLRLFAQKRYAREIQAIIQGKKEALDWLDIPKDEAESAAFKSMIEDLAQGESGTISAPYEGKPAIWAYTGLRDGYGFLVMAPRDVAMAVPDHVRRVVQDLSTRQLYIMLVAVALIALAVGLVAFWSARAGSRFILELSDAWRGLARGDFSTQVDMRTGDERDLLVESFNETVPKLKERVEMRKSLELAEEVQKSLLPSRIPQLEGFEVAGESRYCDQTGGDYFDVYKEDGAEGAKLSIIVGDVTGHGVASALLMASVRAMFRALATRFGPLAQRVCTVNRLLSQDVRESGNFVTLFYLEILQGEGRIGWVRAGHDPAILYDPATGEFSELSGRGLVLGAFEDSEFEESQGTLSRSGQILLIGTDGIWEAHNEAGEMFGKQPLRDIVQRLAHDGPEVIKEAVLEAVRKFRGSLQQEDDITLVVIKKL
jgi:sigma-B regulation protein RsbU (phosphoserine phosphatase)